MALFRKKPVIVEAWQWTGDESFPNWVAYGGAMVSLYRDALIIPTLEGDMLANKGDWIIKGINGEIYPCKPDIFEKSYEEVK